MSSIFNNKYIPQNIKVFNEATKEQERIAFTRVVTASLVDCILLDGSLDNIIISDDGSKLITTTGRIANIWRREKMAPLAKVGKAVRSEARETFKYACFSPDGNYFATCGDENAINIWRTESQKNEKILEGHKSFVYHIQFLDANRLLSSSEDGTIFCWEWRSGKILQKFMKHSAGVHGFDISQRESNRVFSGTADGHLYAWDLNHELLIERLSTRTNPHDTNIAISSVKISPNSKFVGLCSLNGIAQIWNIRSYNKSIETLKMEQENIQKVEHDLSSPIDLLSERFESVSPMDKHLPVGEVPFATVFKAELKFQCPHEKPVADICFSGASDLFITGSKDCSVKIWSTKKGDLLFQVNLPEPVSGLVCDLMNILHVACENRLLTFKVTPHGREEELPPYWQEKQWVIYDEPIPMPKQTQQSIPQNIPTSQMVPSAAEGVNIANQQNKAIKGKGGLSSYGKDLRLEIVSNQQSGGSISNKVVSEPQSIEKEQSGHDDDKEKSSSDDPFTVKILNADKYGRDHSDRHPAQRHGVSFQEDAEDMDGWIKGDSTSRHGRRDSQVKFNNEVEVFTFSNDKPGHYLTVEGLSQYMRLKNQGILNDKIFIDRLADHHSRYVDKNQLHLNIKAYNLDVETIVKIVLESNYKASDVLSLLSEPGSDPRLFQMIARGYSINPFMKLKGKRPLMDGEDRGVYIPNELAVPKEADLRIGPKNLLIKYTSKSDSELSSMYGSRPKFNIIPLRTSADNSMMVIGANKGANNSSQSLNQKKSKGEIIKSTFLRQQRSKLLARTTGLAYSPWGSASESVVLQSGVAERATQSNWERMNRLNEGNRYPKSFFRAPTTQRTVVKAPEFGVSAKNVYRPEYEQQTPEYYRGLTIKFGQEIVDKIANSSTKIVLSQPFVARRAIVGKNNGWNARRKSWSVGELRKRQIRME